MTSGSITIDGAAPLRGTIEVPGDKSISHRALILSSMAEGRSEIRNLSTAVDCLSTAGALAEMGVQVEINGCSVTITGTGEKGFTEPAGPVQFGNSGTGLRLMAGAIASHPIYAVLDGDSSLRKRPMNRIIAPLRQMGAGLWGRSNDMYPPLSIKGSKLRGIEYKSPIASAQVKSAVLIAALRSDGNTIFIEPELSRDHTERMLPAFGVDLAAGMPGISIVGPKRMKAASINVPGDISSAAFWVVAALIVPDSRITITGVGLNPTRTGFLEILAGMGADVSWRVLEDRHGEPAGVIEASYSKLSGISIREDIVPSCIDELPVLSVAASAAEGETIISGASELRVKESDRIKAMAVQLSSMGAAVKETEDGMIIYGGRPLKGAVLQCYGDHRVAMSLSVAALTAKGRTRIMDTGNIETSYPEFENTLRNLMAVK